VTKSAIYERYAEWAKRNGLLALGANRFHDEMKQGGFEFKQIRVEKDRHAKRPYGYVGIGLVQHEVNEVGNRYEVIGPEYVEWPTAKTSEADAALWNLIYDMTMADEENYDAALADWADHEPDEPKKWRDSITNALRKDDSLKGDEVWKKRLRIRLPYGTCVVCEGTKVGSEECPRHYGRGEQHKCQQCGRCNGGTLTVKCRYCDGTGEDCRTKRR
jgi:hypothetical protein